MRNMGKKKLIEVVTINIEDKLDKNGALRNAAVKDAWQRLRQSIEVQAWKGAESVLQELSDSLQKISMLKSMTAPFSQLKAAFQAPDQMVEENDYLSMKDNSGQDKSQIRQLTNDLKRTKDELDTFRTCLQKVKTSLEKDNAVPDQLDIPKDCSSEFKNCYEALSSISEKCRICCRDLVQLKKRLDNSESKNKELHASVDQKEDQISKLTKTVDILEKKHANIKEGKIDSMKEQMKIKSLQKHVEMKESELSKLKQENESLSRRIAEITDQKSAAMADLFNPFPPQKLAEQFTNLFESTWKEAFEFYKSTLGKSEKEAATRLLEMLKDCWTFCDTTSKNQSQMLMEELACPGHPRDITQGSKKLEETDVKQLQNLRKQTCRISCEFVKNAFVTYLESANGEKYSFNEITECMQYIEKCVELCWYMTLQTPSMCMDIDLSSPADSVFDQEKYRSLSGKGTKVSYLMWPPLFASLNGQVLCKGVVQSN